MKNRIKLAMLTIAMMFSFLACGTDQVTTEHETMVTENVTSHTISFEVSSVCDHGNRVYANYNGGLVVIPDPTCQ